MEQELSVEDWKQIAAFYQSKSNDLEMKILALELQMQKMQQNAGVRVAEMPEVEIEDSP